MALYQNNNNNSWRQTQSLFEESPFFLQTPFQPAKTEQEKVFYILLCIARYSAEVFKNQNGRFTFSYNEIVKELQNKIALSGISKEEIHDILVINGKRNFINEMTGDREDDYYGNDDRNKKSNQHHNSSSSSSNTKMKFFKTANIDAISSRSDLRSSCSLHFNSRIKALIDYTRTASSFSPPGENDDDDDNYNNHHHHNNNSTSINNIKSSFPSSVILFARCKSLISLIPDRFRKDFNWNSISAVCAAIDQKIHGAAVPPSTIPTLIELKQQQQQQQKHQSRKDRIDYAALDVDGWWEEIECLPNPDQTQVHRCTFLYKHLVNHVFSVHPFFFSPEFFKKVHGAMESNEKTYRTLKYLARDGRLQRFYFSNGFKEKDTILYQLSGSAENSNNLKMFSSPFFERASFLSRDLLFIECRRILGDEGFLTRGELLLCLKDAGWIDLNVSSQLVAQLLQVPRNKYAATIRTILAYPNNDLKNQLVQTQNGGRNFFTGDDEYILSLLRNPAMSQNTFQVLPPSSSSSSAMMMMNKGNVASSNNDNNNNSDGFANPINDNNNNNNIDTKSHQPLTSAARHYFQDLVLLLPLNVPLDKNSVLTLMEHQHGWKDANMQQEFFSELSLKGYIRLAPNPTIPSTFHVVRIKDAENNINHNNNKNSHSKETSTENVNSNNNDNNNNNSNNTRNSTGVLHESSATSSFVPGIQHQQQRPSPAPTQPTQQQHDNCNNTSNNNNNNQNRNDKFHYLNDDFFRLPTTSTTVDNRQQNKEFLPPLGFFGNSSSTTKQNNNNNGSSDSFSSSKTTSTSTAGTMTIPDFLQYYANKLVNSCGKKMASQLDDAERAFLAETIILLRKANNLEAGDSFVGHSLRKFALIRWAQGSRDVRLVKKCEGSERRLYKVYDSLCEKKFLYAFCDRSGAAAEMGRSSDFRVELHGDFVRSVRDANAGELLIVPDVNVRFGDDGHENHRREGKNSSNNHHHYQEQQQEYYHSNTDDYEMKNKNNNANTNTNNKTGKNSKFNNNDYHDYHNEGGYSDSDDDRVGDNRVFNSNNNITTNTTTNDFLDGRRRQRSHERNNNNTNTVMIATQQFYSYHQQQQQQQLPSSKCIQFPPPMFFERNGIPLQRMACSLLVMTPPPFVAPMKNHQNQHFNNNHINSGNLYYRP